MFAGVTAPFFVGAQGLSTNPQAGFPGPLRAPRRRACGVVENPSLGFQEEWFRVTCFAAARTSPRTICSFHP